MLDFTQSSKSKAAFARAKLKHQSKVNRKRLDLTANSSKPTRPTVPLAAESDTETAPTGPDFTKCWSSEELAQVRLRKSLSKSEASTNEALRNFRKKPKAKKKMVGGPEPPDTEPEWQGIPETTASDAVVDTVSNDVCATHSFDSMTDCHFAETHW